MCHTSVNLTPCCLKPAGFSGTKVPRLDICRSIVSLSKINVKYGAITHSVRNKTTKRTVMVEVGGERWYWTKFEKRRGEAIYRVLQKIGG